MNKSIFSDNYIPNVQVLPIAVNHMIELRDSISEPSKLQNIKNQELIGGLNYSIILNTACIIEGHLDLFIKIGLKILFVDKEGDMIVQEKKIITRFLNESNKASFTKYDALFEIIIGKKIKDLFKSDPVAKEGWKELWTDVEKLFEYRNLLAHGNSIGMNVKHDTDDAIRVYFEKKPESLIEFMERKKLLNKELVEGELYLNRFLSTKAADFFYMSAKEFLLTLAEHATINQRKVLSKHRINECFNNY